MSDPTSIRDVIKKRQISFEGADILTLQGFTQVPNAILTSEKISVGAKLTYAVLLKYGWQDGYAYPGQDKLAKDMGAGQRSVTRWISELESADYLEVRRQGLGKPNQYIFKVTVKTVTDTRRKPRR